jgi:tetratricopeptide (TPR) repeat protein/DNA-binding SARP family transcriptional activator
MLLRTLGTTGLATRDTNYALSLREAALLAYVCEHEGEQRRNELARLLWPAVPARRGLHSLSQLVYVLRRRIPTLALSATGNVIRIDGVTLDLHLLRTEVKNAGGLDAVDIFSGQFLGGDTGLSLDFEVWRSAVDLEVSALVVKGLEQGLVETACPADLERLIAICERLVVAGLAPPEAYHLQAAAYIRLGRESEARDTFQRMQAFFDGLADLPSWDLIRETGNGSIESAQSIDDPPSLRFVGREDELAVLGGSWKQVLDGRGQVAVILGEPGIGKTRLAEQIMRRAALAGARIWTTRCLAATKRVRYSTTASLIREHIRRRVALSPETERVIEAFLNPLESEFATRLGGVEHWHHLVLEVLASIIIETSSERPLVILIDDAQWADDFTAQLMSLWALRIPATRVLLILTARTEEADPVPEWLIRDLPASIRIRLGQLSIEAAVELARLYESRANVVLSDKIRDRVVWQSAGRPLLLIEALAAAQNEDDHSQGFSLHLPTNAEAILTRRFHSLSADATWIVGILSVYGRAVPPHTITEMSGLQERNVAAALEQLSERGIVVPISGRIDFPHDLMRETAYRQLSAPTRMLLHRKVATLLGDEERDKGLLAQHYAEAGDAQEAGPLAIDAAQSARANYLYSDFEYYCRLAIRAGVLKHQVSARMMLASHFVQVGKIRDAEALLPLTSSPEVPPEAALLTAIIQLEQTISTEDANTEKALRIARDIIGMASAVESADLGSVLGLLFEIAHTATNTALGSQIIAAFSSQARSSVRSEFPLQVEVISSIWEAVTAGYDPAMARLMKTAFSEQVNCSRVTQALCEHAHGTLLLLSGNLPAANESFLRAMAIAEAAGDLRRLAAIHMNRAVTLMELGQYNEARLSLNKVFTSPNQVYRLRSYTNLAILHYEAGEDELATHAAQKVLDSDVSYAATQYRTIALALLGLIELRRGHHANADAYLDRLREYWKEENYVYGDASYVVAFIALVTAANDLSGAVTLVDKAIRISEPRDRIRALRLSFLKAELLCKTHPADSYWLAKEVYQQATTSHALPLAARAGDLISILRTSC